MNIKKQSFSLPGVPPIHKEKLYPQELLHQLSDTPQLALELLAAHKRIMMQTGSLEHPGNLELSGEFQRGAYIGLMKHETIKAMMQQARVEYYSVNGIQIDDLALFVRQFSQKREHSYTGNREYEGYVQTVGKYIVAVQNISRILAFIPDSEYGIYLYNSILNHIQTPEYLQVQGLSMTKEMKQSIFETITKQTKETIDFDNAKFIHLLSLLSFDSLNVIQAEYKQATGANVFESKIFDEIEYDNNGENPRVLHTKYIRQKREVVLIFPYTWDENRDPTSSVDHHSQEYSYFGTKPTGVTFNNQRENGADEGEVEHIERIEADFNGEYEQLAVTQNTTTPKESGYVGPLSAGGINALKKLRERADEIKKQREENERELEIRKLLEAKETLLAKLLTGGLLEYQRIELIAWIEKKFTLNSRQQHLPLFLETVTFLHDYPEFEAVFQEALLAMIDQEEESTVLKSVQRPEPIPAKPKAPEKTPTQKTIERLHKDVVGKIEKNIQTIERYKILIRKHIDNLSLGIDSGKYPQTITPQESTAKTNQELWEHIKMFNEKIQTSKSTLSIAVVSIGNTFGDINLHSPDSASEIKQINLSLAEINSRTNPQSQIIVVADLLELYKLWAKAIDINTAVSNSKLQTIKDNFEQVKAKQRIPLEQFIQTPVGEVGQEDLEYHAIETILHIAELVWQGKPTARASFINTIRHVENLLLKSPAELAAEPHFTTPRFGPNIAPTDKKGYLTTMLADLKQGIAALDSLKADSLINRVALIGLIINLQTTCVGFLARDTIVDGINVVESQYHLIRSLSSIVQLLTSDEHRLTWYPQLQMYFRTHVDQLDANKQEIYKGMSVHELLTYILSDKQKTLDFMQWDPNN